MSQNCVKVLFVLCFTMCGSLLVDSRQRSTTSLWLHLKETLIWCMGLPLCVCTPATPSVSVCECGSVQRLIHNDDRKYFIISSHSVIFTEQRGGVAAVWRRWRQNHTETDRDGWRKMERRRRDEMRMLMQLYHNCVWKNNEPIYDVPLSRHQQLQ